MMRQTLIMCAVAAMAGTASADPVSITSDSFNSTEATGSAYMGSMEYNYDSGNSGTLSISLTNMSNPTIGGFLTGFVFNIDSIDGGAFASLLSASDADFLDTGIESAGPFGSFDAGAALGANFSGGGTPSFGMSDGVSESFVFSIIASDASTLSSSSFLSSTNDFYVRFRGLNNGGSDMVGTVPSPGTGALALMGLACMTRRRR